MRQIRRIRPLNRRPAATADQLEKVDALTARMIAETGLALSTADCKAQA